MDEPLDMSKLGKGRKGPWDDEIFKLPKAEALVAQMCGWMYAEACHYMDTDRDIREVEFPKIWEKAQEQLKIKWPTL